MALIRSLFNKYELILPRGSYLHKQISIEQFKDYYYQIEGCNDSDFTPIHQLIARSPSKFKELVRKIALSVAILKCANKSDGCQQWQALSKELFKMASDPWAELSLYAVIAPHVSRYLL
jgi:hypothetical protein